MKQINHKSLAVKYRPRKFSDISEQESVVKILNYMIENRCFPNVLLFCGSAGCGKTTSARIMANEINKGCGNPIELDAASNNSVDNIRKITEEAKFKSLDSEYKVYIWDEVHSLSNAAWQAALKLIEEPPAKTVIIMCTTDPQKIPNTIHSRTQRFDFNKITFKAIVKRLEYILKSEKEEGRELTWEKAAIEYLAKLSEGGLRDAITMMDKCLNYSTDLTVNSVIGALGVQDYTTYFLLTDYLIEKIPEAVIDLVERIYLDGKDLKQFIKQFISFLLDLSKYRLLGNFDYIQIPQTYEEDLEAITDDEFLFINELRNKMIKLQADIKWDNQPKVLIESELLEICFENREE